MYLTQIFMDVCTSLCLNGDTRPKLNNYNKIKIWSNFKNFGLPALEVKLLWEITWDSSVVLLVVFRRLWPRKLEIPIFVLPLLLDLSGRISSFFWNAHFYAWKVFGCLRPLCILFHLRRNISKGNAIIATFNKKLRSNSFEGMIEHKLHSLNWCMIQT